MGFTNNVRNLLKPQCILLFGVMTILILVFQLFAGNGAKPIRQGVYNLHQLSIAIPLGFIWLFFEVGLVEEFFYRVILQSRMKALTGSTLGGIVVSGLLFGLSHAPGMYLRGAGTLDGLGAEPSLLSAVGYSIVTLSCAGFFLGVIWERTRNLWLICAIHAVVDLLPFVPKFISLWSI
jgi:membrane protease YdiL (CAAX protease family)